MGEGLPKEVGKKGETRPWVRDGVVRERKGKSLRLLLEITSTLRIG